MPDDARRPSFDKSRLPSRHVTVGPERAPHRAFLYSMGLTDEQIAQPLVGVATTWNESAPCNIALSRQAQAAKKRGRSRERHAARIYHNHGDRRHRDGP
jgi:dihydroxy-acid dehydratase